MPKRAAPPRRPPSLADPTRVAGYSRGAAPHLVDGEQLVEGGDAGVLRRDHLEEGAALRGGRARRAARRGGWRCEGEDAERGEGAMLTGMISHS